MTCPSCGTTVPADAKFCFSCGHALVSRPDERRFATVLFADLVGFTAFSESADPEHVKQLVDTCFEALGADVTAYGGQVDKIVGDALVALFGAPIAHEDDAERAVRCALQMQHTISTMRDHHDLVVEMRIGVNTGEVLVGALRAGGDYTAMGDVVNTASRLQTAAVPGTVVVGSTTHAATLHAVRYESLGSLTVKGREESVDAWCAIEALARPGQSRRRLRAPLVGRDAESTLLRGIVDAALAREHAQLILLTGDAGVGKSRLAEEVACHAETERGAIVLKGQCVPYGEDVWWPIAETIRAICDVPVDASHDDAKTRVCASVAHSMGRAEDDNEVARVASGLLYLLGFQDELHDVDPTRPRGRAAIRTSVVRLSREQEAARPRDLRRSLGRRAGARPLWQAPGVAALAPVRPRRDRATRALRPVVARARTPRPQRAQPRAARRRRGARARARAPRCRHHA